ncbi:hypothetical protein [Flavobacterium sp. NKUCC04_CG]|uniref:hypothetical protein n=1 Tax=Flavobacterium sp. NKUCC04_CG TaxID=2842121 RepID=UPI001C5A5C60|nr:hypothetical protein [Flavobacterium sp. NKUCC04_CG]MBW3519184.1 hypothetical protein [Flavobacterium sp. NKUCC04_CG]
MYIITAITISRMMSPLRGWLGICLKITAIITATTISTIMSPLRGWFGDLFENNVIPQGFENVYQKQCP